MSQKNEKINPIDYKKLRECIDNSGLKYTFIAKQIGLKSAQSLQRKIDGKFDFKLSEVKVLIEVLDLSWEKDLKKIKEIFLSNQQKNFLQKKGENMKNFLIRSIVIPCITSLITIYLITKFIN